MMTVTIRLLLYQSLRILKEVTFKVETETWRTAIVHQHAGTSLSERTGCRESQNMKINFTMDSLSFLRPPSPDFVQCLQGCGTGRSKGRGRQILPLLPLHSLSPSTEHNWNSLTEQTSEGKIALTLSLLQSTGF